VRRAVLISQPRERHAVNGYRSWHWVVKVRANRMVMVLPTPADILVSVVIRPLRMS
jgi:ppGpp synthetase/RelA/SpoT-type nucleotidyltranferase